MSGVFVAVLAIILAAAQNSHTAGSDKERLIGAWHLASIATPGANGNVQAGYEASFGSYDVDEATHTLTHHVQGSITRDLLVGKDLPRVYQFSADGQLIIKSARPDEHWSVTWEHY